MRVNFCSVALLLMAFGCAGPRGTTKEVEVRIQPNENRIELEELVQSIFSKVNEHRAGKNLPRLILNEEINLIADGGESTSSLSDSQVMCYNFELTVAKDIIIENYNLNMMV